MLLTTVGGNGRLLSCKLNGAHTHNCLTALCPALHLVGQYQKKHSPTQSFSTTSQSPVALTHDPCQVTVAGKELELVNNISPRISWYKRIYMKNMS